MVAPRAVAGWTGQGHSGYQRGATSGAATSVTEVCPG